MEQPPFDNPIVDLRKHLALVVCLAAEGRCQVVSLEDIIASLPECRTEDEKKEQWAEERFVIISCFQLFLVFKLEKR